MEKNVFSLYNMQALLRSFYMGTLKYLWQCLYKNQAIIDGRKRKWWLAVIVFILSIALLMIPILSSGYMTSGGAVLEPSNEKESQ